MPKNIGEPKDTWQQTWIKFHQSRVVMCFFRWKTLIFFHITTGGSGCPSLIPIVSLVNQPAKQHTKISANEDIIFPYIYIDVSANDHTKISAYNLHVYPVGLWYA